MSCGYKKLEVSSGFLVELLFWSVRLLPVSSGSGGDAQDGISDGGSKDFSSKFDLFQGPLCNFVHLEIVCCGVCCISHLPQGAFCKRLGLKKMGSSPFAKKKELDLVTLIKMEPAQVLYRTC